MLKLAVVVCVVLWSGPAEAMTWDFDDGTTQGWSAKEALIWGGTRELHLFPGVIEDGVWRIDVAPSVTKGFYSRPSVELISSSIGYDSGLFDQVRIRFRTVHHSPTVGSFGIEWTNEHNSMSSGWDPEDPPSGSRFGILPQPIVYTTEWQEVLLSLTGQDEKIWEGLLKDIQLIFSLDTELDIEETQPAADVVESFEIDWIELTGVEEILQGELPPPHVEYFRLDGVGLFAPPIFYPIAPGIGGDGFVFGGAQAGVLTDLDGDGDADLFASWDSGLGVGSGWAMALNDGDGTFTTVRTEEVGYGGINVLAGDLTGDGKDEIVMDRLTEVTKDEESDGVTGVSRPVTEVWSIGPELQVELLVQVEDGLITDVADWDGDGRGELFVGRGSTLEVWDVEQGVWTSGEVATVPKHVPYQIGDFIADGALEVLWVPMVGRANTWMVGALDEEFQKNETFEFDEWRRLLGVGDFDGDGQVNFLTEFIRDQVEGSKGIVLQRKGAGDRLEAEVLYDDRLLRRSPVVVRDLNADGVDDWVFIGGDRASGFGVFVEWGGSVNPTQEGEWHRLEGTGRYVLSGDMDSDGDLDLVVLDPILGGVHVLKSSVSEQMTAVMTPMVARPVQHRLGDSYPNPFNPAVVIPLDLATDAAGVSLRVYDVLGRRVRQLWQGPLRAGSYRFTWDGRDDVGKAVAAGVYIYKVEVDGQIEAKKTTKLP